MNWSALPPLSALRAFAAYAQTRSVTQAGDALNVSHAAISQQIRALESHLGHALLDRSKRQATLTPEGETLARALLEGFGTMIQVAEALTGADATRPLQVSTTPTLAAAWLMPRLARFREKHPDISLMIDPSAKVQPLEPGGIDVSIRYGSGDWPGLTSEFFLASPVAVVAAPSLVGTAEITSPSQLLDYHWMQELGTNEATEWFTLHGIERAATRGTSAMPGNLMIEAARQGQGVAIVARLFAEPDIQAGRLRVLFEDDRKNGYHIVTRPGVPRPPLKAFLAWLRREAAKS
ncbi:LysR family transcriptional regulator [Tropicibacter naphthalenivorans]|uniref:Gcv operon activator n=1 Tax=Tropicibacter naphthalenivorans TaxID=441103 RepID=A0A0N7LZK4_9RHOB|nr:LysR family transcriptional regulator [Tropicibacter naphthalenivorans]CUH77913.1 Gcv operon activator [Tropicibacter naphthalenivorans]SMC95174.1 LysR family transcriptional regulator, glycine cleavage system transcriptional activator [Tropicibacter naphthalenivorans]